MFSVYFSVIINDNCLIFFYFFLIFILFALKYVKIYNSTQSREEFNPGYCFYDFILFIRIDLIVHPHHFKKSSDFCVNYFNFLFLHLYILFIFPDKAICRLIFTT